MLVCSLASLYTPTKNALKRHQRRLDSGMLLRDAHIEGAILKPHPYASPRAPGAEPPTGPKRFSKIPMPVPPGLHAYQVHPKKATVVLLVSL